MKAKQLTLATLVLSLMVPVVSGANADHATSNQGKKALADHQCLTCHQLDGIGNGSAPDLARRPMQMLHSPAGFAAQIWNHAPEMLDELEDEGRGWPRLREQDMANLIAYLNTSER